MDWALTLCHEGWYFPPPSGPSQWGRSTKPAVPASGAGVCVGQRRMSSLGSDPEAGGSVLSPTFGSFPVGKKYQTSGARIGRRRSYDLLDHLRSCLFGRLRSIPIARSVLSCYTKTQRDLSFTRLHRRVVVIKGSLFSFLSQILHYDRSFGFSFTATFCVAPSGRVHARNLGTE